MIPLHYNLFILLLLSFNTFLSPCIAFSTRASNISLLSQLQTIQAELLLSIGRVPGTAMPPEWASSGAKLAFPLEVEFTDEPPDEYEMSKERLLRGDALMGSNLMSVEILNEPSFVSTNGREVIKVLDGAYGCQIQNVASQQYALRWFLDFPEGAKRNDVELPAERIYFLSSCWLADESILSRARRRRDTIDNSIQEIAQELETLEEQQQSSGFLQKIGVFKQSIDLVERRGRLRTQLDEIDQTYPLDSSKVIRGPKSSNIIFAKEGMVAVKRFRGVGGTKEQYHWVGTFTFNEFFDDDDED